MGKIYNQMFVVEMRTDKSTFEEWLKEHDEEIHNDAIDIFMEELQEVIDEHGSQYVMMYMKERAKQLKR